MRKKEVPKLSHNDIFGKMRYHIARKNIASVKPMKHKHDFYEIILVLSSEITHTINGKKESLKRGSVRFIRPKDTHELKAKSETYIGNIAFTKDVFEEVCNFMPSVASLSVSSQAVCIEEELLNIISTDIKKLENEINNEILLKKVLCQIVYPLTENSSKLNAPLWLINAAEKMNKRENIEGGVKKFTELCGKSREHVIRQTKKYFGASPSAMLNKIKLSRVTTLLQATNKNILDIAFECGFSNASYFYGVFKKVYGCSPSVYRKRKSRVVGIE